MTNPAGLNVYNYAYSDPVNLLDADGLDVSVVISEGYFGRGMDVWKECLPQGMRSPIEPIDGYGSDAGFQEWADAERLVEMDEIAAEIIANPKAFIGITSSVHPEDLVTEARTLRELVKRARNKLIKQEEAKRKREEEYNKWKEEKKKIRRQILAGLAQNGFPPTYSGFHADILQDIHKDMEMDAQIAAVHREVDEDEKRKKRIEMLEQVLRPICGKPVTYWLVPALQGR